MKYKKAIVLSSIFALSAIGCGGTDRNMSGVRSADTRGPIYESAGDTTRRDTRVIRGEERTIDSNNWREARDLLARKGYSPGSSALADQQTRDAIAKYQRNNNIRATGLLDSRTLIYMQRDGAGFTGTLGAQLEKADADPTLGED
jgi:hypothetical protein